LKFSAKIINSEFKQNNLAHKVASMCFLFWLITVIPLSFLSFFSNVSTTINIGFQWSLVYFSFFALISGSGFWLIIKNKGVTISASKSKLKNMLSITLGILGLGLLLATAIFSGLPTLMHHMTSIEGEMKLTIVDKKLRGTRYECSPALIIEEFTWYASDRICLNQHSYQGYRIGDKIVVSGLTSPYGVEVLSINKSGING
jgi:uncharacterized membrane protein